MASLSEVTDVTRKLLEIIGIGIAAIILLVIIFNVGMTIKEILSPTPPPPPTVAFGKISDITFPSNTIPPTLSFTLNTLTGSLPILPDRMTVYKLQQAQPNLLNLDKAKNIAQNAGFTTDPTKLTDTSYMWTNTTDGGMTQSFTMDIQSFDFHFTSSYKSDQTVLNAQYVPDEETAVNAAEDYFAKFSPLPSNIDTSKTKTTLWSIVNGGLIPATSLSDAQIVRVDFFPQNVDKLPIYTSNPADSFTYALVASSQTTEPQIVEAQLYHKAPTNEKATYPIITAQQAFNALKKGQGYIASLPNDTPQISITNVSLGYYLDITSQNYLLPIIIFQGDKGFFAYISAVQDVWIQK